MKMTPARFVHGALAFFTVSALFGAAFVVIGPVAVMRLLGLVALALAAAGCGLELWAMRSFDPPAYALLMARLRGRRQSAWSHRQPALLHSVVLSPRPAG